MWKEHVFCSWTNVEWGRRPWLRPFPICITSLNVQPRGLTAMEFCQCGLSSTGTLLLPSLLFLPRNAAPHVAGIQPAGIALSSLDKWGGGGQGSQAPLNLILAVTVTCRPAGKQGNGCDDP